MSEITNHLWQSAAFAGLVALAAFVLRGNPARTRYWLWLAASMKFLLPFSLLVSLGTRVEPPIRGPVMPALAVEQISTTFAPVSYTPGPTRRPWWPRAGVLLWLTGSMILAARWSRRWMTIRRSLRSAALLPIAAPIPVMAMRSGMEPGVFGIWRPILLLPDGIIARLSAAELEAILAHELSHIRRRDNLTAALHMLVETVFWFVPLVWWIGRKLVEERERACDEAVLETGSQPGIYAQSILNVCRYYLESPLPCATGVTGADLKMRIEEIMTNRTSIQLSFARKAILSCTAVAVLTTPLLIGVLRAQTLPPPPAYSYEVATVRPSKSNDTSSRISPGPQGGLRAQNVTTMTLLRFAYGLQDFQFSAVPDWVNSNRFDVTFTPDQAEALPSPNSSRADFESQIGRQRQRLQAVLRDRFKLVLRSEKRELSYFALTVAKGGPKLTPAKAGGLPNMQTRPGSVKATSMRLSDSTRRLAGFFGRHVSDETGLEGLFDFYLSWNAGSESQEVTDADRSAIVTALQEQLGLKLESRKGPVPVLVVEKIEKPSEN